MKGNKNSKKNSDKTYHPGDFKRGSKQGQEKRFEKKFEKRFEKKFEKRFEKKPVNSWPEPETQSDGSLKIDNSRGFIFPQDVKEIYYKETFDLRMTSNFKQFKESDFPKHLDLLSYLINDFCVFDMTGNIGCDAVNISTILKDVVVFTCELDKLKATCMMKNCSGYGNIFVFNGDSDKLLKSILTNQLEEVLKMCISSNKTELTEEILKKRWLINIDPPFGKDYKKENNFAPLEFNEIEILQYLNNIDLVYSDRVIEYVVKSPLNWDRVVRAAPGMNGWKRYAVYTKNSGFFYNVFSSFELREFSPMIQMVGGTMTGGVLLENIVSKHQTSEMFADLVKLNEEYVKKYHFDYTDKLNSNEFRNLLERCPEDEFEKCTMLTNLMSGKASFKTIDGRIFYSIPCTLNNNYNKFMLFNRIAEGLKTKFSKLIALKMSIVHGLDMKDIFLNNESVYKIYEKYANELNLIDLDNITGSVNRLSKKISSINVCDDSKILSEVSYPIYSITEILTVFERKFCEA